MSKCCGTCEHFCWTRETQSYECWDDNNIHEGEYREYWDAACDKYKQEGYKDYDVYTK